MPLKTLKLLIFHITPIISASVAELCRRAAEYPLLRLQFQIKMSWFLGAGWGWGCFFSGCTRTFAENTVRLTVTCVKFNYGPAVDALCVTQGDWKGAAARRRLCRQQQTQITVAWAAARSWACAITQPTDTPRVAYGHSSSHTLFTRLPPSLSLHSGQWEKECNRHCWTLLSIIHVLLLK